MRLFSLLLVCLTLASSCRMREGEPTLAKSDVDDGGLRLATVSLERAAWQNDFVTINDAYASPLAKSLIDISRRLYGITAVDKKEPKLIGFIMCGTLADCDEKRRNLEALVAEKSILNVHVVATRDDKSASSNQLAGPTLIVQIVAIEIGESGMADLQKLRSAFSTELSQTLRKNGFQMGRSEFAKAAPENSAQLLTGLVSCSDSGDCKTKKSAVESVKGVQVLAFTGSFLGPVGNKAGGGSGQEN